MAMIHHNQTYWRVCLIEERVEMQGQKQKQHNQNLMSHQTTAEICRAAQRLEVSAIYCAVDKGTQKYRT